MAIPREEMFWDLVRKDCWNWVGSRRWDGYGRLTWHTKQTMAHRVSWELANGPIPEGMCVLHACDNTACVNPAHLRLGTQEENMAEKYRKRRHTFGEKNWCAKLTEGQVLEIRATYKSEGRKSNRDELAKKYGVSPHMIWKVATGRNWKHLPGSAISATGEQTK